MSNRFFPVENRSVLRVRGPDAGRYLNGQLTVDIPTLAADNARSACILTPKGKLVADLLVRREGADAFLLESAAAAAAELAARAGRYIVADDVEVEEPEPAWALHFLDADPGAPRVASRRLGAPGWDRWFSTSDERAAAIAPLCDAGWTLVAPDAVETMRIAAGIPAWGTELGPDVLPAEAGLDRTAVDFHKGCYVGQEVVSRLQSVGRANRLLCVLRAIEGTAPAPGAELTVRGETKPAGVITSVIPPGAGEPHALAYLRRGWSEPGTRLRHPDGEVEVCKPTPVV